MVSKTKIKEVKEKYVSAVGRRKEAIARIRLYSGKGETTVNGKNISDYFPGDSMKVLYLAPFVETGTAGKYYVSAKIVGGGISGQLTAFVHGVSRTLSALDKDKFRPALKKKGYLTRDSRTRERRKVGTGGKARRKKQSPKR